MSDGRQADQEPAEEGVTAPSSPDPTGALRLVVVVLGGLGMVQVGFGLLQPVIWPVLGVLDPAWLPSVALGRGLLVGLTLAGLSVVVGVVDLVAAHGVRRRAAWGWWIAGVAALLSLPVACGGPALVVLGALARPEVRLALGTGEQQASPQGAAPG